MELLFFIATASYLLGSIPFSYLIAKRYGKSLDILGLYNIRAIKTWKDAKSYLLLGIILAGDVIKGALVILMASRIASKMYFLPDMTFWALVLASTFVVIGDNWSIFDEFKGKKRLSTLVGIVLVLDWKILLISLLMIFVFILISELSKKRKEKEERERVVFIIISQFQGRVIGIMSALLFPIYFLNPELFFIILAGVIISLLKHHNQVKSYWAVLDRAEQQNN